MTTNKSTLKNESINSDDCKEIKPRVGLRPSFHALWHLFPLGVVENLTNFTSNDWEAAARAAKKKPIKVAIIDTPVAYDHPNLCGAVDIGLMRDFSTSDVGDFVVRIFENRNQNNGADLKSRGILKRKVEGVRGKLEEKIYEELTEIEGWLSDAEKLKDLKDKLNTMLNSRGRPTDEIQINQMKKFIADLEQSISSSGMKVPNETKPDFGSHGTSVAGLIGARPTRINLFEPPYLDEDLEPSGVTEDLELPYAGINPFCKIIPISVSSTPNPSMLLQAVQYARLIDPDVVVIADSWDRPKDADASHDWQAVERAFLELCKSSIVLCAAGNEPRNSLVYPASLSRDGKTGEKGVGPWAVGACDKHGVDLSYSPDFQVIDGLGHRMIKTLSSEHSRYDRDLIRLDPWENVDPELKLPRGDSNFPPANIVTTDVPGDAGYNPSPYSYTPGPDDCHYEIASLFCRFSGTSASTAIAAGLVSLALATSQKKGKPPFHPKPQLFDLDCAKELVTSMTSDQPGG